MIIFVQFLTFWRQNYAFPFILPNFSATFLLFSFFFPFYLNNLSPFSYLKSFLDIISPDHAFRYQHTLLMEEGTEVSCNGFLKL
jgi:hypothetical protein